MIIYEMTSTYESLTELEKVIFLFGNFNVSQKQFIDETFLHDGSTIIAQFGFH